MKTEEREREGDHQDQTPPPKRSAFDDQKGGRGKMDTVSLLGAALGGHGWWVGGWPDGR